MNKFSQPQDVTSIDLAFPARVSHLMPEYSFLQAQDIPRFAIDWQRKWFYEGLDKFPEAREGVDQEKAMRHLACIQGSFEPKHEHKEAAVAWLAHKWLVLPGCDEA